MADDEARIEIKPPSGLTHQELTIDFLDLPGQTEFSVNINGPIAQTYWATLKTDPFGQAQLIWRTQAAGDYSVKARGSGLDEDGKEEKFSLSSDFTVANQPGDLSLPPTDQPVDADVKTVEPSEPVVVEESEDPDVDDPAFADAKGPSESKTTTRKAASKSTEKGK